MPHVNLASLPTRNALRFRMLEYGVSSDIVDEYIRMSESGCLEALDLALVLWHGRLKQ
jgi:hypothetical protein